MQSDFPVTNHWEGEGENGVREPRELCPQIVYTSRAMISHLVLSNTYKIDRQRKNVHYKGLLHVVQTYRLWVWNKHMLITLGLLLFVVYILDRIPWMAWLLNGGIYPCVYRLIIGGQVCCCPKRTSPCLSWSCWLSLQSVGPCTFQHCARLF